jgi:hypothetical protein
MLNWIRDSLRHARWHWVLMPATVSFTNPVANLHRLRVVHLTLEAGGDAPMAVRQVITGLFRIPRLEELHLVLDAAVGDGPPDALPLVTTLRVLDVAVRGPWGESFVRHVLSNLSFPCVPVVIERLRLDLRRASLSAAARARLRWFAEVAAAAGIYPEIQTHWKRN